MASVFGGKMVEQNLAKELQFKRTQLNALVSYISWWITYLEQNSRQQKSNSGIKYQRSRKLILQDVFFRNQKWGLFIFNRLLCINFPVSRQYRVGPDQKYLPQERLDQNKILLTITKNKVGQWNDIEALLLPPTIVEGRKESKSGGFEGKNYIILEAERCDMLK